MKSKLIMGSVLLAMFAGAGISPAMAQNTNTPMIDRTQEEISGRVQQGLASGRITPSEAQQLYRREREIQLRENRFKADGAASPQERQQLRQELDGLRADVERAIASPAPIPQQPVGTPGLDERQYRIHDRIEEGIRSGRITDREARRLYRRESELARHEARFKADGVVTQQERRQLRSELGALRDDVERMLNNERRDR